MKELSSIRFVRKNRQFGQGMTEYIIIVALIAVAAIGVYSFFGQTVRAQMAGLSKELAGESSTDSINKAKKAGNKAKEMADKDVKLSTYDAAASGAN